jgi:sugar phosphate isomerase/epimerase
VTDRIFGVSTRLFQTQRLSREHLVHIAAHGFEAVELVTMPSHFDCGDTLAAEQLAEWLSDTRLRLHAVHAESDNVDAAAALAARVPFDCLVIHPEAQPDATRRRIESAVASAAAHSIAGRSVAVAVEVMASGRWNTAALTRLVEEDLEDVEAGICLDFGHAHLGGDIGEAIETVSGHLRTTHVHDNRGRNDDHLVPFSGTIDWDLAMMETQKIGYDGVLMFEIADTGDPVEVLRRAAKARERLEKAFVTF